MAMEVSANTCTDRKAARVASGSRLSYLYLECSLQEDLSVTFHSFSTRKKEFGWPYTGGLAEMSAKARIMPSARWE